MKREELEQAVKDGRISRNCGIRLYHELGFHLDGTECLFDRRNSPDYVEFIRKAESLGIPKSYSEWAKTKRELLERYFPGTFNRNNQDLSVYSAVDIGKVFHELIKYARKQAGRR